MSVEIGIRIKADNMSSQGFDALVGDMKRVGRTTKEITQDTEKLRKEFNTLGNKIQENSKLTLDANSRWKDAQGKILNTREASKQLEAALAEVSDEQLKQIRVFRDAEGTLQDIRGGYISNAEAARRFAQGIDKTSREFAEADKEARKFSNTLSRHRTELRNVALGAAAVTAGMGLVGKSFVQAGIQMEGYRNGLIALEGSAEAADARLTSLRDIIQLPGVSYEGAIQAAVRLRTVGFEAELADRTITEFGNSLALVGSTDLSGALLGFQQIISRGRVSQEEINQIVERSGLFANALQKAFGSIQAEQIQANLDAAGQSVHDFAELFISELEKLDRVDPDSAANSIQNLKNSLFELRAGFGDILLPTFTSVTQGVTSMIKYFNAMDDTTKSAIVSVGVLVTGVSALTTVVTTAGAAIGALNAYLLTTTGASGFAGLAALIAPAAPLLVGLGALAAVLGTIGVGFAIAAKEQQEYERVSSLLADSERNLAEQVAETAKVIGDDTAIRKRISALDEYIEKQKELLTGEESLSEQLSEPGAGIRSEVGQGIAALTLPSSIGFGLTTEPRTIFDPIPEKPPTPEERTQERINSAKKLKEVLLELADSTETTEERLKQLREIVGTELLNARRFGITSAIDGWRNALDAVQEAQVSLRKQEENASAQRTKEIRNYALEIVNLEAALRDAEDAFRNSATASAADEVREALRNLNRVKLEEIDVEIAANQKIIDNEKSKVSEIEKAQEKIAQLQARRRQNELQVEYDITQVTQQETEKRLRHQEAYNRRIADQLRQANREQVNAFRAVIDQVREINDPDFTARFGQILTQFNRQGLTIGNAAEEAFTHVNNFTMLTDGIENSIEQAGTATRVYAAILRRELFEGLQTAAKGISFVQNALQGVDRKGFLSFLAKVDPRRFLEENERRAKILAQAEALEGGGFSFISATGLPDIPAPAPERLPIFDRFAAGGGDLIASVPLDVVDAVASNVQLRRDANAEILQLEQETAAEIRIIQENVTLSAENKAKAIERIERQSALERVRIENEVSQRQRASFQSVVTDFLSGIAQMIAAEAQLALARRATSALSGLFGGGAAAAGGAGLLSSVLLPLAGGISLAYGASKLIGQSPSAAVYQQSQYGSVGTSGEQTNRGQQGQGVTRASQESETANVQTIVNVEVGGQRLVQHIDRQKAKVDRWGGT